MVWLDALEKESLKVFAAEGDFDERIADTWWLAARRCFETCLDGFLERIYHVLEKAWDWFFPGCLATRRRDKDREVLLSVVC